MLDAQNRSFRVSARLSRLRYRMLMPSIVALKHRRAEHRAAATDSRISDAYWIVRAHPAACVDAAETSWLQLVVDRTSR